MVVKKGKILVAMSGGVDSSVAAALLVKASYDVTGAFMINYEGEVKGESCWHSDYQDALRVAAKLKIPLLRLDFVKEYKKSVLDYTFKSYSAGRTPNPDILCNKFVKFGAWLEKAKELGFDKLATGHYARITCHPDENRDLCQLMSAKDTNKDQTYFLHQLNQKQLSQTLFPIGNYTKPEVRALAKKFDLPTAEKAESMGICFVGEVPMREFLKGKVKAKPGKIISTTGEVVGSHDGLPFYTIGERVGGLFCHSEGAKRPKNPLKHETLPMFVIEKNTKTNTIIVGPNNDPALFKKEIIVTEVNWLAGQTPKLPLKCKVRLRHRQELQDCTICHCEAKGRGNLIIKFTTPQRAITPGQFAVFYRARRSLGEGGESFECLGGGEIM